MVTGIRQDAYANANPIQVEEMKKPEHQGKYLHPQAFGLSATMGIDYDDDYEKTKLRWQEQEAEHERMRMQEQKRHEEKKIRMDKHRHAEQQRRKK